MAMPDTCCSAPIPVECFAPPRVAWPRAWERVPVAPVPGRRRQSKIWKRVGGVPPVPNHEPYIRAMAELETQGLCPRKRERHARHFASWGDAIWDPRADQQLQREEIERDLEEARGTYDANSSCMGHTNVGNTVSVALAEQQTPETLATGFRSRPATFPEENLKWIPKKRDSSRWPITAEEQTPRDVPVPAEPVEVALKMDETQMSRRSTRRASSRLSLSPRKLLRPASPVKDSGTLSSPVKRAASLSPTKVADSPLSAFRVKATPTRVVLEAPEGSVLALSPSKPSRSPATPTAAASSTNANTTAERSSSSEAPSPAPLLFDQPVEDVHAESPHEARRRISLQSARRTERTPSGVARLLALKKGRSSPNRRHSFTSLESIPESVPRERKGRRNTMDIFCVGPDEVRGAERVVEVDMRKSLDIFAQAAEDTVDQTPGAAGGDEQDAKTSEQAPGLNDTSEVPVADCTVVDVTADIGVDAGADNAPPNEAAADASHIQAEADGDQNMGATNLSETPLTFGTVNSSETMFTPADADGLSTIYEESTFIERATPDAPTVAESETSSAANTSPPPSTAEPSSDDSSNAPPSSSNDTVLTDHCPDTPRSTELPEADSPIAGDSASVDGDVAQPAGSAPEARAASHVAESAGAMFSDDWPQTVHNGSPAERTQQTPPVSMGSSDSVGTSTTTAFPNQSQEEAKDDPKQPEAMLTPTVDEDDEVSLLEPYAKDLPSEPVSAPATAPEQAIEGSQASEDTITGKVNGFTPINCKASSPADATLTHLRDDEEDAPLGSDDMDADEVVEEDVVEDDCGDATAAMDEEATVVAPRPENDTLQLHAKQDDSETEMLRNFVTRVTADKNARAAAAAAALAKKCARRSSLLASMTSSTGSPMMRDRTEADRAPLRARSPNSPSPTRKRKLDNFEDEPTKNTTAGAAPSNDTTEVRDDKPRLKRRKRADAGLDSTTETPSPDSPAASQPRRSSRSRIALRPSAPSANSIALSMLPMRLPSMGAMSDDGSFSPAAMAAAAAAAARQRAEDKDLAALTRANTRKNKGGAVPPQMVLARQAEDPTWRMNELKGVYEAKERRANGKVPGQAEGSEEKGSAVDGGEANKSKKAPKSVRWAEELVSYHQPDNDEPPQPSVFRSLASQLLADVTMADDAIDDVGVDEIAEAEPPAPPEPVVEKTARVQPRRTGRAATAATSTSSASAVPSAAPTPSTAPGPPRLRRSTRSSRLPPPTPVKKMHQKAAGATEKAAPTKKSSASAAAKTTTETAPTAAGKGTTSAPSLRSRARKLPKLASASATATSAAGTAAVKSAVTAVASEEATAPSVLVPSRTSGMTTRRTRIAKLGMGVNGTPAPKRRGRAAAAADGGV
ncbi:hypothetical protein VTJ49DRAFT_3605 [Mycothermus thermophilus]|uniref:Inner centromere protein ARK-binding domain-containing protein n=1 Tax=Humicola insolens TaxID=85995 RepID=A0ABR3VM55_HUMIN